MKVFLSWSGDSRRVAEELRSWLQSVIQALKPWFSPEDIAKGAPWSLEIAKELNESKAGIVCVTPRNQHSSWLNFEAGAIANATLKPRVCTLLIGMKPSDLSGPLTQFQATEGTKADMRKLVGSLNSLLDKESLSDAMLDRAFDAFWPPFEDRFDQLVRKILATRPTTPSRPDREILEETLGIVREMRSEQSSLAHAVQSINRGNSPLYNSLLLSGTEGLSNWNTLANYPYVNPTQSLPPGWLAEYAAKILEPTSGGDDSGGHKNDVAKPARARPDDESGGGAKDL
jgi:hypothetical protein